jgi:isopentenyldiphosphate isomerase
MKIPIVDEQDNILYYKDPEGRDKFAEVTRITALWLFNEKKEVLVAKRSHKKKYHPNLWGMSVAGTVEEGETYESNMSKEVQEELGILPKEITKGPKSRVTTSHAFFVQWFFALTNSDVVFKLQDTEVDEAKWITTLELEEWFKNNPHEFVPSFPLTIEILKEYENKN